MPNVQARQKGTRVVSTGRPIDEEVELSDSQVTRTGRPHLMRAIEEIGKRALRSPGFSDERKQAIALQLDFLESEAAEPQDAQNAAIIKPVLNGLQLVLCASADMHQAWNTWGPTLVGFFSRVSGASPPGGDPRLSAGS
jgi:hypothetical protein